MLSTVLSDQMIQLPPSLQAIARALIEQQPERAAAVRQIVIDAGVQPEDLSPWADFDHPVTDSYGRKLVFKAANFEIMVMSWRPGDFSTIHDHGHTQWGAVQIFGPAEHATFRWTDDQLHTLARWQVAPGDVVGVNHRLIHQMGNPTRGSFFLSLHVYGEASPIDNVTGDARIFDLAADQIQRVDGGVFFGLSDQEIKRCEAGPKGDFPTRLRHMIELSRRLRKREAAGIGSPELSSKDMIADAFSDRHHQQLLGELAARTDANGHQTHSVYWRSLTQELKVAADFQAEIKAETGSTDAFHQYAARYDALIGQPCLDSFMRRYLFFVQEKYQLDLAGQSVISLGCGTGLVEQFMQEELGVNHDNLYGIDVSPAMVNVARRRMQADVGDILQLDPSIRLWDIAYSGLNVFHYLPHEQLAEAIQRTADIIKPGGYFIGDFITPDHIRWYPNVMHSADQKIISLRTPALVEENGRVSQASDIINLDYSAGQLEVHYAGRHQRFLPPLHRVRQYFQDAFGGKVACYDAKTLEEIPDWADSCPSTRYVIVAQKG
jgi:SAM-dependent methyltransferase/predicted metal-dependent enzyme (double-stranded beta helix superfamily)